MDMTLDPIDAPTAEQMTTVNDEGPEPRRAAGEPHRIDLQPAYRVDPTTGRATGHGKAVMSYNGEVIGVSREPAFAAARYLLAHGLALPSDLLTTYRDDRPCIYTRVGRAAKLTVAESGKSGPRFVAFREPPVEMLRAGRERR